MGERRIPERVRVRIRMRRDYSKFGDEERESFLRDIEQVSGCAVADMQNIEFRPGCVIFEGNLDKAAVDRLIEVFDKQEADVDSDELTLLISVLKKHKIEAIETKLKLPFGALRTPSKDREIVFVHGWSGDHDSFGDLPRFLSDRFKCDASVYDFPTGLRSKAPSLVFIATNFDNWLRLHIGAERIALVAHSMGGLVARKFLVTQSCRDKPIDKRVAQLTFVASPHNGSVLASFAKKLGIGKSQLLDLDSNSGFLYDLDMFWTPWVRKHVPEPCSVRSVFGMDDNVVTHANAKGLDPEAVPIAGLGHRSIVKPDSVNAEVVVTIARFLRESRFFSQGDV